MKPFSRNSRRWIAACVIMAMILVMAGCSCGQDNGGESSTAESTSQGTGMQESTSQGAGMQESTSQGTGMQESTSQGGAQNGGNGMQESGEIGTSSTDGVNQMTEPEYGTGGAGMGNGNGAGGMGNGAGADGGATDSSYMPGTYTGSAKGYGGTIEVTVEVDEARILSIDAVGESETPNVGQTALTQLTERIIEANSTDIDGVSGATYSSQGLFEAVDDALAQASAGQ